MSSTRDQLVLSLGPLPSFCWLQGAFHTNSQKGAQAMNCRCVNSLHALRAGKTLQAVSTVCFRPRDNGAKHVCDRELDDAALGKDAEELPYFHAYLPALGIWQALMLGVPSFFLELTHPPPCFFFFSLQYYKMNAAVYFQLFRWERVTRIVVNARLIWSSHLHLCVLSPT